MMMNTGITSTIPGTICVASVPPRIACRPRISRREIAYAASEAMIDRHDRRAARGEQAVHHRLAEPVVRQQRAEPVEAGMRQVDDRRLVAEVDPGQDRHQHQPDERQQRPDQQHDRAQHQRRAPAGAIG